MSDSSTDSNPIPPPRISRLQSIRDRLLLQEDLNFLVTNRIPRDLATRLMGRLSRIRNRWFTRLAIGVWRLFTDLDLSEAKEREFVSIHDCFTRELRPGARPIATDPNILVSPCDALVGECGRIEDGRLYQAKGFPYRLEDLFGSRASAKPFLDGSYVTLRLTSSMYHRFHAPDDGTIERVTHIQGDTWNVNPIALKRVERLFCRNERAVIHMRLADGTPLAIAAIAAILVASLRLRFLDILLHRHWTGPNDIPCHHTALRGEELGWFEHGSTLILFAPNGFRPCRGIRPGVRLRMGQPLMERPEHRVGSARL